MRDWAVQYLPSVVESLTPFTYNQKVVGSTQPYLVDFYAPCMLFVESSPLFLPKSNAPALN